jgi:NADH-ubiquinone oxidoreductase chain 2
MILLTTYILTIPLSFKNYSPKLVNRLTIIGLVFIIILSYINITPNIILNLIDSSINLNKETENLFNLYSGYLGVTNITQVIEMIIYILALILLTSWPLKTNKNDYVVEMNAYSYIILFSLLGSSCLISSSNLVSIFLSLELQSFGVYLLSALYRNSESATAAGLKYFLLGALSSTIILLGSAFIYSVVGTFKFDDLILLLASNDNLGFSHISQITLGIFLILCGFLFKLSSAPFHNWAPDVYNGTPTIVTSWLTTIPKYSIFTFLIIWTIEFIRVGNNFEILNYLIIIASLLSLIVGTVLGLSTNEIKRLIAFSGISHVGFLLIGYSISILDLGNSDYFYYYLIQYSLTNVNIFLIILGIGYITYNRSYDINYISELKNLWNNNRPLALSFILCLFSIAGIPPLVGFFGKYNILYLAIENNYYFLALIGILTSVISASYYLKLIRLTYPSNSSDKIEINSINNISTINITSIHSYIISVITLMITLYLLYPDFLYNACKLMVTNIII